MTSTNGSGNWVRGKNGEPSADVVLDGRTTVEVGKVDLLSERKRQNCF
jgi:hypothetical protein